MNPQKLLILVAIFSSAGYISRSYAQGVITTVAGIGVPYVVSSDSSIPAASANIINIGSIAIDPAGNVFFRDQDYVNGARLLKVDPVTGIITTVLIGSHVPYGLPVSFGICIDSSDNVYYTSNAIVQEVFASSGLDSTIAGIFGSSSSFSVDSILATDAILGGPACVCLDPSGNILIADPGNNTIRKITKATGIITKLSGIYGSGSFTPDGTAAISSSLQTPICITSDTMGNIFFFENGSKRVRRVDKVTGILTTIAGGGTIAPINGLPATNAHLNAVSNIATDNTGNLYIAMHDSIILKVSASSGLMTIVAGGGSAGMGDGGPATNATLWDISGIASDVAGNIFIADHAHERVREVYATTGIINTIAGDNYIGDNGPAITAVATPCAVASDASGNIFFTEDNRIRKIDMTTGIVTTLAGNGDFGSSGDGGPATNALLGISKSFSVCENGADEDEELNTTTNIATDASGNIYFADVSGSSIRKIDMTTGTINKIAGQGISGFSGDGGPATNAELSNPSGVAVDATGNIYIADYGNGRIRKVDASTGIITTLTEVFHPFCIVSDYSGNIYYSDVSGNRIYRFNAGSGTVETIAGNGYGGNADFGGYSGDGGPATNASLFAPAQLTIDASGNIFFADSYNNRIREINVATGVISTVAGNGYGACVFEYYSPASLDPISSNLTGGFSGDGGASDNAQLFMPTGVCVDPSGNLFIADQYNYRIRRVSIPTSVSVVSPQPAFSVFPNPSSGQFIVYAPIHTVATLQVLNVIGETVYHSAIDAAKTRIDLSDKPVGLYTLSFRSDDYTQVLKLVICH